MQRPRIACGTFLAPSNVSEEVFNADASRRLLSLRRDQLQRRQPYAVPVSALLLLDLPQERGYCKHCGTPLWVSDEQWPELVHPFASAIDTELPKPPSSVHLLLRDKASWVEPQIGPNDDCFDGYPELSIEDWHKKHGLWIE